MILEHLAGIAALILFAWSVILLWATWRLCLVMKELDAERTALRRWQRLHALAQRQNVQWQ